MATRRESTRESYLLQATLSSGKAFAAMDGLFDAARSGPTYLLIPEVASMVVDALHFQAANLGRYTLHAYVVMANHVHAVVTPRVPISTLTRTLKSYSARQANKMLNRRGPFWAEETFDRTIRNQEEFGRICAYVENNSVKAGVIASAEMFPWSSAKAFRGDSGAVIDTNPLPQRC